MKKISKLSATFLVVMLCILAVLVARAIRQWSVQKQVTLDRARTKGPEQAPVKIVEFMDFQCPGCARATAYVKEMMEKHPDAIRVQIKHFPLSMHRNGYKSSRYAECAARQGRFWPYLDLLLARQNDWAPLVNADSVFLKMADETGLDRNKIDTCLKDETIDKVIQNDKKEGQALGVKSTPTFFVNGKMAIGWYITQELPKALNVQED